MMGHPVTGEWEFGPRPINVLQLLTGLLAGLSLLLFFAAGETAFLVIGILLGVAAIVATGKRFRSNRGRVSASAEGITVVVRDEIDFFRWDEIDRFYLDARSFKNRWGDILGYYHGIRMVAADGRCTGFAPCASSGSEIAGAVLANVLPRMKESAVRAFFAPDGQPVEFGPVSVSPAGLRISPTHRLWDEIRKVFIRPVGLGGILTFSGVCIMTEGCGSCDVKDVPNLPVLIDLIEINANIHVSEDLAGLLRNLPQR